MQKIPEKLPIGVIDQYIVEFDMAVKNREKYPNRFYAKGVFMMELRDSIEQRLERGMSVAPTSESASNHWANLLTRYEAITNKLLESERYASLGQACERIFNTERYSDG